MASLIKIKRSGNTASPTTLGTGELAYSWFNGTNKLYIGTGTETAGAAANIDVIGGKYFTDMLDHTAGTLTASSAIIVDVNSKINQLFVDNISIDGNAITSTDANGDITITPAGTGKTVIANIYTDASTSLQEYIYDTVGGAVTAGTGITVTNSDPNNTSTISITNTGVTAASYGSATAVPVLTINEQGQITAASTANIATTLNIAGNTGTDGIALLTETLTVTGTAPINAAVTANTITITAADATTSTKGVASFNTASFEVASGAVSIKAGGVSNTQLANSSVTIGSTTTALGATSNSLAGLQQLTVDNIDINGNTISATNTDGSITLTPLGTGTVDVSGKRITSVAEPTQDTDAATKAYVDSRAAGLDPKASVRVATTGNITLSNTQTIDGVALSIGNRVLVRAQSTSTENGIYIVANGAWARAADFDAPAEITAGAFFFVEEGTQYADTGWVVSSASVGTVGSDAIEFTQFSGAGQITAGDALSKTGSTLNVVVAIAGGIEIAADALQLKSTVAGAGLTYADGVIAVGGTADRITVGTDSIDIAGTYAGQNTITTLGTIGTGVWQATVIAGQYGGTGVNNAGKTITLGGNLTTSGAHATTLTTTAETTVTLPATGTLATLAGTESLTNKTLGATTIAGHLIPGTDIAYDLGSANFKFRDLYLSGSSIKLGGATISSTDTSISVGAINSTPIGSTAPSTAAFTTLTANGAVTFTANTASTTSTTGTVVVTGGMGISGNITGAGTNTLDGFVVDGGTY